MRYIIDTLNFLLYIWKKNESDGILIDVLLHNNEWPISSVTYTLQMATQYQVLALVRQEIHRQIF